MWLHRMDAAAAVFLRIFCREIERKKVAFAGGAIYMASVYTLTYLCVSKRIRALVNGISSYTFHLQVFKCVCILSVYLSTRADTTIEHIVNFNPNKICTLFYCFRPILLARDFAFRDSRFLSVSFSSSLQWKSSSMYTVCYTHTHKQKKRHRQ